MRTSLLWLLVFVIFPAFISAQEPPPADEFVPDQVYVDRGKEPNMDFVWLQIWEADDKRDKLVQSAALRLDYLANWKGFAAALEIWSIEIDKKVQGFHDGQGQKFVARASKYDFKHEATEANQLQAAAPGQAQRKYVREEDGVLSPQGWREYITKMQLRDDTKSLVVVESDRCFFEPGATEELVVDFEVSGFLLEKEAEANQPLVVLGVNPFSNEATVVGVANVANNIPHSFHLDIQYVMEGASLKKDAKCFAKGPRGLDTRVWVIFEKSRAIYPIRPWTKPQQPNGGGQGLIPN